MKSAPGMELAWADETGPELMGFARLEDWNLDGLPSARRSTLLEMTPFHEIVAGIAGAASLTKTATAHHRRHGGHRRIELEFSVPQAMVDLWHNGRGGYRAQYLLSEANGRQANSFAVSTIARSLGADLSAACLAQDNWLVAGLIAGRGKIWIGEGLWSRAPRRELVVPLWRRREPCDGVSPERALKLMRMGAAAPGSEGRLRMKGEWLGEGGVALGEPTKPRASEIRLYGYT